jgi:hypothetical protein
MIVTAEEDGRAASRRRTVVAQTRRGPTVRRIDQDGENNEKSSGYPPSRLGIDPKRILATASTNPPFASFSTPRILEDVITDYGLISDGRLSILTFREP